MTTDEPTHAADPPPSPAIPPAVPSLAVSSVADSSPADSAVIDNVTGGRFELEIDGHLALLVYRRTHGRMILINTEVPPVLQGHGVAGRLVQAAIDDAVHDGLVVAPLCPYARAWIEKHPESAALVEIQWPSG